MKSSLAEIIERVESSQPVSKEEIMLLKSHLENLQQDAEVEKCLNRVRERTNAMQSSEELPEAANNLFLQVQALGIPAWSAGYCIWEGEDKKSASCNMSSEGELQKPFSFPTIGEGYNFYEAAERGDSFYIQELGGEELVKHYEFMTRLPGVDEVLDDLKNAGLSLPTYQIFHIVYFRYGYLMFITYEPVPDSHQIFLRFGKVFEQTYTRFLDLKKAEKQSHELEIDASLEKIRAHTNGMQDSSELADVINVVFDEALRLGFGAVACDLVILDEESGTSEFWISGNIDIGADIIHFKVPKISNKHYLAALQAWKNKVEVRHHHLKGREAKSYLGKFSDAMIEWGVDEKVHTFLRNVKEVHHTEAYMKYGYFRVASLSPLKNEEQAILVRFAQSFEQTYTRFLDLKKAENQAREAQIETALERVRARTMAMHSSDELTETVVKLFNEFSSIGYELDRFAIGVYEEDKPTQTIWTTAPGGKTLDQIFEMSLQEETTIGRAYQAWKDGVEQLVIDLQGKDLQKWFQYVKKEFSMPVDPSIKRRIHNMVFFSNGWLDILSTSPVTDTEFNLLHRFAKVFEQTYTRFQDLKKAEEQTRQANIEVALERVRARALAMQEPEELIEVAKVMRKEMGKLDIEELETSSIYLNQNDKGEAECWYALKDVRDSKKPLVSDHFNLNYNATWVGKQMFSFYKSKDEKISIPMKGKRRIEWIDYCIAQSPVFRGYYGDKIPDRTYHLCKFSNGSIGMATPGYISKDSWDLLERACSVFSLAYSRFRDLTQARNDLEKLKEEKQRAENALTDLRSTQTQLIHAEKMASLGELTAGIAHEIQNPLNFVNNFSDVNYELLEELVEEVKNGNKEEVESIIGFLKDNESKIIHHGKRADAIVKSMLQHSRGGSGEKEPTDLNELVDEYLRLAYHGLRAKDKSFNAEFKLDLDESLPKIEVVPQEIGRVLLNLINNAFQATSSKVKAESRDDDGYKPLVTVSTKSSPLQGGSRGVEISVADNGPGIPDEIKDKIFEPFFTTKATGEGTGLGLSMSYDIVTKGHGGELSIAKSDSSGTTFIIILPV